MDVWKTVFLVVLIVIALHVAAQLRQQIVKARHKEEEAARLRVEFDDEGKEFSDEEEVDEKK